MFKQLTIASAVLAASSGIAFAQPCYKGERIDYKNECPSCSTCCFAVAPYIGVSVGIRDNYTGTPTVFKGVQGLGFLGYGGLVYPNFYLAAEVFGGGTAKIKDYRNGGAGVKSTWDYGLDVIPGLQIIDPFIIYARGGVIRTRFDDVSRNATGWRAGLGGEVCICQNWDLRGEYVYAQYQRVSDIGKARSDTFNVAISYRFF